MGVFISVHFAILYPKSRENSREKFPPKSYKNFCTFRAVQYAIFILFKKTDCMCTLHRQSNLSRNQILKTTFSSPS